MPDTNTDDAREDIGHGLAERISENLSPDGRSTATRDVIHEMIMAGDEEEVTPDLLQLEHPEEWTDADFAEYEATELDSAPGEARSDAPGSLS